MRSPRKFSTNLEERKLQSIQRVELFVRLRAMGGRSEVGERRGVRVGVGVGGRGKVFCYPMSLAYGFRIVRVLFFGIVGAAKALQRRQNKKFSRCLHNKSSYAGGWVEQYARARVGASAGAG